MNHPSRGALLARPLQNRQGIIVLGPLIAFVCLLIVMVVAGKLMYPPPRGLYISRPQPELHYAVMPAPVYSGERVVMYLQPGDSAWIVRLDNGSAVVFRDPAGGGSVGVTTGFLTPSRPVRRRADPAG